MLTSWRSPDREHFRPPPAFWILVLVGLELFLTTRVYFITTYFTPLMWTAYIFAVDGVVLRRTGRSLISDNGWFTLVIGVWSVVCWVIFEAYNLHLDNWHYVGIPDDLALQVFGYVWAFATIFPGIFETYDLVRSFGLFAGSKGRSWQPSASKVRGLVVAGILCLVVPLALPTSSASFLFGLVWLGFVLVLDPITDSLGGEALLADLRAGSWTRLCQLLVAGAIAGFLWEFWNYWATAKWIYLVPKPLDFGPHIFEMPLLGFLGFPPFAVECFVFQALLMAVLRRPWDAVKTGGQSPKSSG